MKIRVLLGFTNARRVTAFKKLLIREPDIEIVGETINNIDLLLEAGSTHANVVTIDLPMHGKESGICSHLLAEYPDVKIFAVSEEGNKIVMHETAMMRREIYDILPGNLVDLIRWSMSSVGTGRDSTSKFSEVFIPKNEHKG